MKIVAISDTHNLHNDITIPECDVLIHAGDASFVGTPEELDPFWKWFRQQPAKYLIFVPGNHEVEFYHKGDWRNYYKTAAEYTIRSPYINVLVDSSVTIDGIKFYGSPWTHVSPKWGFQFPWWERDSKTHKATWEAIPEDVNVLITHSPPSGILDQAPKRTFSGTIPNEFEYCGDKYLAEELTKRKQLSHHFFGHIHESHGHKNVGGLLGVDYYNVAICDRSYTASNPVTVVEINSESNLQNKEKD